MSSVTTYERMLRGFERVSLKPGEEKQISFVIEPDDLALHNRHMEFVTESGKFNLYIGSSSEDIRLKDSFTLRDTK